MIRRVLFVLVGILIVVSSGPSRAEDKVAVDSQKAVVLKRADARAILEAGQTANSLPAGVVVHVSANLTRVASETRRHGAGVEKTFNERWEFTADRVHRIVEIRGENGGNFTLRRAESIPFDSAGMCKEMLDGGILKFGEAEKGERQNFIDTDYDIGHRSIETILGGKSVLWVGEACVVAGYVESDARAFGLLYEKLAMRARSAFDRKDATHAN